MLPSEMVQYMCQRLDEKNFWYCETPNSKINLSEWCWWMMMLHFLSKYVSSHDFDLCLNLRHGSGSDQVQGFRLLHVIGRNQKNFTWRSKPSLSQNRVMNDDDWFFWLTLICLGRKTNIKVTRWKNERCIWNKGLWNNFMNRSVFSECVKVIP